MFSRKTLLAIIAALVIALAIISSREPHVEESKRVIIGRVERAILQDYKLKFKARVDTGAGISSLNAKILEIQEPTAENELGRVVFEVNDKSGKTKKLDKEIVEWANIKHKGSTGFDKRPVVEMDICLGGKQIQGRVNLADRSSFIYPLLIGRNILKAGDFLIDPEQKYMEHPTCSF